MTRPDDEFGDELDPPMDGANALLFAVAFVAAWLTTWSLYLTVRSLLSAL